MHDDSVDGVAGQGGQAGTADTAESMVMTGDMMMDPGGSPLAVEAADRDGLSLDVLHLGLGPALPRWSVGLQFQVTLQGDVISAAARPAEAAGGGLPRRIAYLCAVGSVAFGVLAGLVFTGPVGL